ncbi:MAG: hypothetical protein K0R17_3460 [Rariglobus sp.]|jgi:hypothetical protein|nr:hypothetical protein [Rariglobus sp.]
MKIPALLTLALALALPSLKADIVFGNLAALTNGGATTVIQGTNGTGKAIGFTMGTSSYEITSVTLRLLNVGNDLSTDVPLITIWTSNGNKPMVQVGGTFTNPTSYTPLTSTNYTFTPASTITLDANQSYFLVVRGNNAATSFDWLAGSPTVAPTGVAGSAISRFGLNTSVPNYSSASSVYNWFQIDGTAISVIPEPSTYAVFIGISVLGLAIYRRRSRVS